MFKNNRSIKQQILFSSLGLLLLAFIINAVLTGYFINNKSQEVLIEKAREQVYEMSKQAEDILDREDDPINALQEFVDEKAGQDNVAYAVVIDTNATAVAHSDHEKLNVVYDDDYTIRALLKVFPNILDFMRMFKKFGHMILWSLFIKMVNCTVSSI